MYKIKTKFDYFALKPLLMLNIAIVLFLDLLYYLFDLNDVVIILHENFISRNITIVLLSDFPLHLFELCYDMIYHLI